MFHKNIKKHHKALLIGTGGGNDIVSAIIPALELQKFGIKTDIAGILSPGATHAYNGTPELVVNRIEGIMKRHIPSPNPKEISFIDSYIAEFTSKSDIEIGQFYDFSVRYGTRALAENVNRLISKEGYDIAIGIDVGGDILARGAQDRYVLSPLMDFSALNLLANISIPSYLLEFGLGTDGELRHESITDIINSLKKNRTIIHEDNIDKNSDNIKTFKKIFNKVKTIRQGHTAVMTLKTLESDEDIISKYIFRTQIGQKKWLHSFDMFFSKEYFGKTYLIDAKMLQAQRTDTAFNYKNSLEQYVRLKFLQPTWKTELDMSYLWSENNWTNASNKGESLFLLIPSKNIQFNTRKDIMQYGEKHFHEENIDSTLILASDKHYLNHLKSRQNIIDVMPFSIIYKDKDKGMNIATDIKKYVDIARKS